MLRSFRPLFAWCLLLSALMLIVTGSTPAEAKGHVTLSELLSRPSIYIRDLDSLDLDVKQGDGPVRYALLDANKIVQFWFKPGLVATLGRGKVVLVTSGDANDENHGTILWPKDKVGHDYGKELESLYQR
jgi:hypothetical protein